MIENYIITAIQAAGLRLHIMEFPAQMIDGHVRLARQVRLTTTDKLLEFLRTEGATDFAFLGTSSFKGLNGDTLEPEESKMLRFDWWPKSAAYPELKNA